MFSNDGGQEIASRFSVTHPTRLRSATWFGGHPAGPLEPVPADGTNLFDYRLALFEDVGNAPAATPFLEVVVSVRRIPTGATAQAGALWFSYSAEIGELMVGPGAYWLSVAYVGNNSDWLWGGASNSHGFFYRVGIGPWQGPYPAGRSGAFTLFGAPG